MADDFNPKSNFKITVLGIFLLLFLVTAYFGYTFISEAERSASGIKKNNFNKNNDLDFSKFDQTIKLPEKRALPIERSLGNEVGRAGDDVRIKAGEFAYYNSQPRIKIALENNGLLTVNAVAVSVSLFLDDEKEPVASAVGIPISLAQTLEPQGEMVIDVPVVGESWQSEMVRLAKSRRVLAQIISVSDSANINTEYPQTGQGAYLKQTGNDWSVADANPLPANDFASTVAQNIHAPPPDFADPTANMDLSIPKPVEAVKIEPVSELKLEKLDLEPSDNPPIEREPIFRQPESTPPTQNVLPEEDELPSETGVISYEFKSFQK